MTGRSPQPCGYISDTHDGPTHYYACGWRCTTHGGHTQRPAPAVEQAEPAPPAAPIRKATSLVVLQVSDVLFIDCGDGYEIKHGDNAGQIRYRRPPRARFECVRCEYASEIVTGPAAVQRFVATARTDHRAICPALTTNQQGAQAA